MPSFSSVRTRSTCCCLVSGFFTEVAQHIHSLRASGVRSSHTASASASDARVFRKSSGNSWTTPPEILLLVIVIRLYHYKMALARKDCGSNWRLLALAWLARRADSVLDLQHLLDTPEYFMPSPRSNQAARSLSMLLVWRPGRAHVGLAQACLRASRLATMTTLAAARKSPVSIAPP